MKKLIIIFLVSFLVLFGANEAKAQFNRGFSSPNYWKLSSSVLSPLNDSWSLSVPSLAVGAITMSDNLDMDGNCILLDADQDTFLCSPTDDQIDFVIGGATTTIADATGFNFEGNIRITSDLDTSTTTHLTTLSNGSFLINSDNGFIGIGVANASSTLHIANNGWFSADSFTPGLSTNIGKMSSTTDNWLVGTSYQFGSFIELADDSQQVAWNLPVTNALSDGDVVSGSFQIDGNNVMTVYGLADGSGGADTFRVGIGTTNPRNILDVKGTTGASRFYGYSIFGGGANNINGEIELGDDSGITGKGVFSYDGSNGDLWIQNSWASNNATIKFNVKGSSRLTIKGDGNVGIGTTTPSELLHIDNSSATSTVMIGAQFPGCIGIKDTDNAGVTYCTTLDGTLTCSDTNPCD